MSTVRTRTANNRRTHPLAAAFVAALIIVLVECFFFNAASFASRSASPTQAGLKFGPGLEQTGDGLLRVSDATQAYIDVSSNGSSDYAHVDMMSAGEYRKTLPTLTQEQRNEQVRESVHVRLDDGSVHNVDVLVSRSAYLSMSSTSGGTVRLWVEEPVDSFIPITGLEANVRVPFQWNWGQVAVMALLAAVLIAFAPRSRLWRVELNTKAKSQRAAFFIVMAVLGVYTAVQIFWQIAGAAPMAFHTAGRYSYDYDQYDHVAQALLNGHVWLDLPVPQEFSQLANPYDTASRDELLNQGVTHIYWDYAYHDGHWYSYFGVLPALLLFLPYRAVTSLFVPGGLMLPNASAELLLMSGAAVFACLLVVRVLKLTVPKVSVATTSLLCCAFVIGSNMPYFWHRTNFYSIPFSSSMLLIFLGLWLWLGAGTANKRSCSVGGAPAVSLRHVAAGALCIAATAGCRPTFALTAVLAFAIFAPQIGAVFRRSTWRSPDARRSACKFIAAMLIPAIVIMVPVVGYNYLRFGSFTDFGNAYQITVADMTDFHTSPKNMPYAVFYYLFLPLTFSSRFPFLQLTPAPTPTWFFTETTPGGLFVMTPLAVLALAVPFLRKPIGRLWATLTSALALGVLLLVFDAYVGGFAWRYFADFAWCFMLGAIVVTALIVQRARHTTVVRVVFVAVMLYVMIVCVASHFVVGRDDALVNNFPSMFVAVDSWFSLLP